MCLDIFNGGPNNNQPHLAKCANFTGQFWILTRTDKWVEGQPTRQQGVSNRLVAEEFVCSF
jgi:hypothetical protein